MTNRFKGTYDSGKERKFKTPSEKQVKAWTRNWHICRLRAYFHSCPLIGEARTKIQKLIDLEIIKLGAESEILREAKRREELERECNGSS